MSIKRFLIMIFAVSLFAIPGTAWGASDVKTLFPDVDGFTKSDGIVSYRPDNLFEYINGAAELYILYDFSGLNLQQYMDKDENTITIEIYDHKTVNNSFGIYSQERPYECEYLDIGAQAAYIEGYLNFYQGRYYVKITGYNLGSKDRELLTSAAGKISGQLGDASARPAMFSAFPETNRVANREEYIPRDFLGYSFFEKAFTVECQDAGSAPYKLFIIESPDRAALEKSIDEYKKAADIKNDILKQGTHEINDPYQGKMLISVSGKYIVGALNPDNAKIDYGVISQIISSLK